MAITGVGNYSSVYENTYPNLPKKLYIGLSKRLT